MNKCKRLLVACIGIDKDSNIETGQNYNKTECKNIEGGCGCIHAEMDLLSKMPHPVKLYITHSPCVNCAAELIKSGIKEVYYIHQYRSLEGLYMLKANNIKVVKMER